MSLFLTVSIGKAKWLGAHDQRSSDSVRTIRSFRRETSLYLKLSSNCIAYSCQNSLPYLSSEQSTNGPKMCSHQESIHPYFIEGRNTTDQLSPIAYQVYPPEKHDKDNECSQLAKWVIYRKSAGKSHTSNTVSKTL